MYSSEITQSITLKWSLGALAFVYFIAFNEWIGSGAITKQAFQEGQFLCPAYLQSCEMWYVFSALPYGYSQSLFYMILMTLIIWSVYQMTKQEWASAQLALMPAFVWHFLNAVIITDNRSGNYEYYIIVFGIILLFFPHKEFFLKISFVFLYMLSTVAKIHPSWIEGAYFSSLRTGIPLFPDWSIPIITNVVILAEMVGAWFLLSANKFRQRLALAFFIFFHFYSGIFVLYRYPATVLPFLLSLFGPHYSPTKVPLDKKSIWGWSLIIVLLLLQFSPKLIPGDEKLTMEGNKYGLYMFESNHQCVSQAKIVMDDGTIIERNAVNANARNRCEAYRYWFDLNNVCKTTPGVISVEWTLDHSINGSPFYRIVDERDACSLTYEPFKHNEWIKYGVDAPVVGYPVKNYYR